MSAYQSWKNEERFVRVLELDELVRDDYNLLPTRYIRAEVTQAHRGPEAIFKDIRLSEDRSLSLRESIEAALAGLLSASAKGRTRDG